MFTLNVIHEIGSSSGIGVRLMSFRDNSSSSNSKVNIAPGGVQVPTMRWCFIFTECVIENRLC